MRTIACVDGSAAAWSSRAERPNWSKMTAICLEASSRAVTIISTALRAIGDPCERLYLRLLNKENSVAVGASQLELVETPAAPALYFHVGFPFLYPEIGHVEASIRQQEPVRLL